MKPSLSDEKYDIIDELNDLGFPTMASSLEEENPGIGEYRYYGSDLERARRETTEEEMSEQELSLIHN